MPGYRAHRRSRGASSPRSEAPLPFEHVARRVSDGHGFGHLVHVGHAEAISGQLASLRHDAQVTEARDLLRPYVDRAGDALDLRRDGFADGGERFQLASVDENGHVRSHAGNELVGAHLDGLRNGTRYFGHQLLEPFGDLVTERLLGHSGTPLGAILQGDVDVRLLDSHTSSRRAGWPKRRSRTSSGASSRFSAWRAWACWPAVSRTTSTTFSRSSSPAPPSPISRPPNLPWSPIWRPSSVRRNGARSSRSSSWP